MLNLADPFAMAMLIWASIGGAVAAVFLLWGVDRIDAAAHGARAFRVIVLPGVVLLWPVVLWRWLSLSGWKISHDATP